ncbi:ribonuclease P protein component [bacterium]|nr:ribonuclease P protein component [bacterium]
MGKYSLRKSEHLRKNSDFRRVYSKGRSCADHFIVLFVLPNDLEGNRIGLSVSKKIGKAVKRNRVKRLFREVYRLNKDKLIQGFDLIFLARKDVVKLDFPKMERSILRLYKRAKILKPQAAGSRLQNKLEA